MLKKAMGLALAIPFLVTTPAPTLAQTVDEVLAKHFEAIGGVDNWKEVQSMRMSGTLALSLGLEGPFKVLRSRPDKFRIEFTIQGMTGVESTDGKTFWTLLPFAGQTTAQEMDSAFANSFKDQADFDGLLMGYKEAGNQIELLGTEDVSGSEAYKLKVTTTGGNVSRYYIDKTSHLIVRIEGSQETQGAQVTTYENLGDYKPVGDLLIAHKLEIETSSAPGTTQVLTVEKVELNPEVTEAAFAMPEAGSD